MNEARSIRRVLITGIHGSGASYLAEYIAHNHPEVEIHGLARWHSTTAGDNLAGIRDQVRVHEADLVDFGSVFAVLQEVQPDAIFHIAAYANVRASFITPQTVLANNVLGTSTLFEAVRLAKLNPIIQLCSTSEVYGQVDPKFVPIKEDAPLRPVSPYAVSKTAADLLGYSYFVGYQMPIIRTRMFAYMNPRRPDLFATAFARQVAWIERGLQKELVHGNLDSVRTLIDVRDAMEAYWVAITRCRPGEIYNIGGRSVLAVREILDRLIAHASVPIPTRCDSYLLRPADITLQVPCVDKFENETGWQPKYTFDESIVLLLDFWRRRADQTVRTLAAAKGSER